MECIREKYNRLKLNKDQDYTGRGVTRDSKSTWGYTFEGNHHTGFRTYEEACHEVKLARYTKQSREIRELLGHYEIKELKELILMKSFKVDIPVRSVTINSAYQVSGHYNKKGTGNNKDGEGRHMFLSEKAKKFKSHVRSVCRKEFEGRMLTSPIKLTMHNFYTYNYGRDVGNPNKFIQDALEKVVFENDVEVFEGLDRKVEGCRNDMLTIIVEEIIPEEVLSKQ